VYRSGEAFSILPIFALLGTVFFGFAVFISGEAEKLTSLSWVGISALAGAGIVHFILGRLTGFTGIRLIGANRAVPIFSGSVLVAVLFGIFLLGESMTVFRALAILLIVGGIILIGTTGNSEAGKSNLPRGILVKGVLAALAGALFWGASPTLIKIGLREVNSPLLATFISYSAAFIVVGASLIHPGNSGKLRRLSRPALISLVIGGIAVSVAQILRYTALVYSPVSMVEPLSGSTNSLFIFPLSFLLNRQIEAFNRKIILGAISIVVGVFFMFWVA
jgi:drug/metabolite transporter (DMT)-like permease